MASTSLCPFLGRPFLVPLTTFAPSHHNLSSFLGRPIPAPGGLPSPPGIPLCHLLCLFSGRHIILPTTTRPPPSVSVTVNSSFSPRRQERRLRLFLGCHLLCLIAIFRHPLARPFIFPAMARTTLHLPRHGTNDPSVPSSGAPLSSPRRPRGLAACRHRIQSIHSLSATHVPFEGFSLLRRGSIALRDGPPRFDATLLSLSRTTPRSRNLKPHRLQATSRST